MSDKITHYSEIIDLKKKSLDATKKEQDYQKTISKKLKELAKLQERIDALSLDDTDGDPLDLVSVHFGGFYNKT